MQLYQNNFKCCFNGCSYQHIYEYRCESEDKANLDDLEERIEKLEKE